MRDIGRMTSGAEEDTRDTQMAMFIRASFEMVRHMATGYRSGRMVRNMMASGKWECDLVWAFGLEMRTAILTWVSGAGIKLRAMGHILGQMGTHTKVSG